MNKIEVKFDYLNPEQLKSDGQNPNVMTKEEKKALIQNITKFGFISPIIVNQDLVIADGEQRWDAAKSLRLQKVPVVIINIKEVDRKILRQVMNKLRGKHNPLLDFEEFKKIADEKGLSMLENLTFIPEQNIAKLIKTGTIELDDLDKIDFYGGKIAPNDAVNIKVNKIKPNTWNPTNLGNASYKILKRSIKTIGLLNPIIVHKVKNYYELIDGENRWKATKELGNKFIQAKIIDVTELEAKAISFSLNKIKGKLAGDKSTALVNALQQSIADNKRLQDMLGLDKKKLDRYLAFGEDGVFFETASGLTLRKYTDKDFNEQKPSLIFIFKNLDELNKVKSKLLSINKNLTQGLLTLCGT